MSLPLLKRVSEDGLTFGLTKRTAAVGLLDAPARGPLALDPPSGRDQTTRGITSREQALIPDQAPGPGEQYRFHFNMGTCIGCKCCVVACNEQNGNPAAINWRRVGEIEGGWYPNATRAHLSMGCNHCLEPTCLAGCPVDAYSKDPLTGIVSHSADACIGCQYCTWNCSYGVPQYNAERGVVGKCDMCHGRLSMGEAPACVNACPEGAIAIEIVNVADWRAQLAARDVAPGLPVDDNSLSTTRITMPATLPPNARPRDITHVVPEHPHWPLVVMTVLTQLSVGAFATLWLLQVLGASTRLGVAAITALMVGGLALSASTLHLGRPAHAYRAIRMWRRSWLSREVLLFSAFSGVAGLYAGALWFGLTGSVWIGAATVVLGAAGLTATACIYRVPSRPAWNTPFTVVQFALTGGVLGPLFVAALGAGDARWLATAAMSLAGAALVLLALRFLRLIASDSLELRGTARLLSTVLRHRFVARGVLLVVGAMVLPLFAGTGSAGAPLAPTPDGTGQLLGSHTGQVALVAGFALALAGEVLGRYLFFVSVVPKHMTAPYVAVESEAS
jgi:formate dehydrogenase iron-sulfur subunit